MKISVKISKWNGSDPEPESKPEPNLWFQILEWGNPRIFLHYNYISFRENPLRKQNARWAICWLPPLLSNWLCNDGASVLRPAAVNHTECPLVFVRDSDLSEVYSSLADLLFFSDTCLIVWPLSIAKKKIKLKIAFDQSWKFARLRVSRRLRHSGKNGTARSSGSGCGRKPAPAGLILVWTRYQTDGLTYGSGSGRRGTEPPFITGNMMYTFANVDNRA